ncbi:hypothetical protein C440_08652 [Haloferax mucosum ATCC BAA-1512]|uniref:CAAX prenyl protease 2/Lysostaphin resistance protein A-like domain-containing protein n=1 Tax=Haloferax mucosum ATCC BAA-1512 TaxID=662479 RepID=M0IH06_9EURY|nr:CPBP family intramembrane glutamic endopeptidase [Haloferax mucosum]ELZ95133.1 hypothetical protein C440_08652 [Haloferax mucosum ATCC BAA-1512]
MSPRRLVWNDTERRPTAPLRLLTMPIVVVLVVLALAFGVVGPLGTVLSGRPVASVVTNVVSAGATGIAGLVVARYIDRRTLSDLGFGIDRDWMLDLGFGLALGAVLMGGIFLVGLATGWFTVDSVGFGGARLSGVASLLALFVVVGISEELLVRGVVLTDISEGLRWKFDVRVASTVALVVSAAVFGVIHLSNPNSSLASTLSITLAGVMLGLGYVLSGDLAIPIGLHITWNFFQGGVFGFSVSGLSFGTSVVATTERGPDVITGGAFGPEAGLLGVGAILVGTAAIAWYVRARYGNLRFDPGVTVPELRWKRE